ncbi:amidohydrolase family protein [Umezawaea sp. NPDC059074]|uniref:amidohydrolase family protein n=1 Tax=Umezawaea sp. NPDC059074 TaxID=3346716 RepID=UPI00369BFC1F
MRDLLITGGFVVTLDETTGDLPGGDVLIRDGRIAAVGHGLEASDARVVDARGRLVLPGLVDTHRHVWQGALGGLADRHSLIGYSREVLGRVAPHFTPDDSYAGTLWGALQALDAGITTVADWSHNLVSPAHTDAVVRALADSGIRGVFLHGGPSGPDPVDVRGVRERFFADGVHGRLRMGLAVPGPAFGTPAATKDDFALARDLGLPISVHVGMAGFPDSVATLDRLGLLGPDVNHVHATRLSRHEFELIADSGGSISLTPSTDVLMALGTYPATGDALRHRLPAGLGVDTVTGAGTDLFSEMRLALAAERSRTNAAAVARHEAVPTVDFTPRDVLRLATLGGAEVWHLDHEIGSLSTGKRADLALLDLRSPHLDGYADPVTTVVLGAGPADVETVIVDGEVVKDHGRLVGPHARAARDLVRHSRTRLRSHG